MKDWAVYLDLDGVMANYDEGIRLLGFNPDPAKKNELNRSGSKDPFKRKMYEAIKGTEFYRDLPLMPGAIDLYRLVKDANPIIVTAAPKFGATEDDYYLNPYWLGAAYHKRHWTEYTLLPQALSYEVLHTGSTVPVLKDERIAIPDTRFICTTSARKQEFMHRKRSLHQLLIDDRKANCDNWIAAGGYAILHVDAETTIAHLNAYRRNYAT